MNEAIDSNRQGDLSDLKKTKSEVDKGITDNGPSQLAVNRRRLEARLKNNKVIDHYKTLASKLTTSIRSEILDDLTTILAFPEEMEQDFICRGSFYCASTDQQVNEGLSLIDKVKGRKEGIIKEVYSKLEKDLGNFQGSIGKSFKNLNEHLSSLDALKKNLENYAKFFNWVGDEEAKKKQQSVNDAIKTIDSRYSDVKKSENGLKGIAECFENQFWDTSNITELNELKKKASDYMKQCDYNDLKLKSAGLLQNIDRKQKAISQFKRQKFLANIPLIGKLPLKETDIKEIQSEIDFNIEEINKYMLEIQKLPSAPQSIDELKKLSSVIDSSKYKPYSNLLIFQNGIEKYHNAIENLKAAGQEKIEAINKGLIGEYEKIKAGPIAPSSLSELENMLAKPQDNRLDCLLQAFDSLGNSEYSRNARILKSENEKRLNELKEDKTKLEKEKDELAEYSTKAKQLEREAKDKDILEMGNGNIVVLKELFSYNLPDTQQVHHELLKSLSEDVKKKMNAFKSDKEVIKSTLTEKLTDKYNELKRDYNGKGKNLEEDIAAAKSCEETTEKLISRYSEISLPILSDLQKLKGIVISAREEKEKLLFAKDEIIDKCKILEEVLDKLDNHTNGTIKNGLAAQLRELNPVLFDGYEGPYLKDNARHYKALVETIQEKKLEIVCDVELRDISSKVEQRTGALDKDISELKNVQLKTQDFIGKYSKELALTKQTEEAKNLQQKIMSLLSEYASIHGAIDKINNNYDISSRLKELSAIKDNLELSEQALGKIKEIKAVQFDGYAADRFGYSAELIEKRKKLAEEFKLEASELPTLLENLFKKEYNKLKAIYEPNKEEVVSDCKKEATRFMNLKQEALLDDSDFKLFLEEIIEMEKVYEKKKKETTAFITGKEIKDDEYEMPLVGIKIKPIKEKTFHILKQKYFNQKQEKDKGAFQILKQKYFDQKQKNQISEFDRITNRCSLSHLDSLTCPDNLEYIDLRSILLENGNIKDSLRIKRFMRKLEDFERRGEFANGNDIAYLKGMKNVLEQYIEESSDGNISNAIKILNEYIITSKKQIDEVSCLRS
ncbi:hypothetical protein HYU07_05095 [Candidatus Woesearchaeota archaeon]|nr:hypothetical protein [Candidatus Woesearchaeota archaeon]